MSSPSHAPSCTLRPSAAAHPHITPSKHSPIDTSYTPLFINVRIECDTCISSGKMTKRCCGQYHNGSFSSRNEYHGNIPLLYASSRRSILRSPPTHSSPSGSTSTGRGNISSLPILYIIMWNVECGMWNGCSALHYNVQCRMWNAYCLVAIFCRAVFVIATNIRFNSSQSLYMESNCCLFIYFVLSRRRNQ